MANILQNRRDIESEWEKYNPILHDGEFGIVSNNNKMKVGDGKTKWLDLPFIGIDINIEGDLITTFGADNTGTFGISSALTYAINSSKYIVFPVGTYRISSNITIPSNVAIVLLYGAKFTIDSGVTLTIQGPFSAHETYQVFTGAGSVIGVRKVYPEWWGAKGDGATDDIAALTAAHTCIQGSLNSFGGRPTIVLRSARYAISSTWTIIPTANIDLEISGSGTIFSGTQIVALSSFGASPAILIDGNSDGTQCIADWKFNNLRVVPSASGCGSATVGIQIGSTSPSKKLIGLHWSEVENVYVSGFPKNWFLCHIRLVKFTRCSGWEDARTDACENLYITVNGGFTGDLRFEDCQFVAPANVPSGSYNVHFYMSSGQYNNGNNQIAGIKFIACDFYYGDISVYGYVITNCGWLTDIWFTDCQWDGNSTKCVDFACGDTTRNLHFDNCYMSGANLNNSVSQMTFEAGGKILDVFVSNCWLQNATGPAITAWNTTGIIITNSVIADNNNVNGPAISLSGTTNRATVANNLVTRNSSNYMKYFIQIESTVSNYIITGNQASGIVGTSVINDLSTNTKYVSGNI